MDADPFGLASRDIKGAYSLERFESGSYYLNKEGHEGIGGGCIDGVVVEIGWNDKIIAAKRIANFRSDGDGWMLIDLEIDTMSGPLTESEFREILPDLETMSASEAWEKL